MKSEAKLPFDDEAKGAATPRHIVRSIEVRSGFLAGVTLVFADALNVIIGGRGAGKTTIVELLRFAFGLTVPEASHRNKVIQSILKKSLRDGPVKLRVATRHGVVYDVERDLDGDPRILDEKGEAMPPSLIRDLAPALYGLDEIEEIARDMDEQVRLLDALAGDEGRDLTPELERVERELTANAVGLVTLDEEIEGLEERAADVTTVEKELAAFQGAGSASGSIEEAHRLKLLRENERRAVEQLLADVRKARRESVRFLADLARGLDREGDPAETPNQSLVREMFEHAAKLREALTTKGESVALVARDVEEAIAESATALQARHTKQESEYSAQVAALREESGRAGERSRLQKRLADATAAKQQLDRANASRRSYLQARGELLKTLKELRDRRSDVRARVAERLTKAHRPAIKVSVLPQAGKSAYKALLEKALTGMKHGGVVERCLKHVTPAQLARIVRERAGDRLAELISIDEDRAANIVRELNGEPIVYEIEAVELEDLPLFALLTGKDYTPSEKLSTGQQCSALLPILLHESDRPLVIDQPEDNLDNKYIYETVVKALERAKARRQFILVSHNPNVPVLAEAERVFVLESDGSRGWIAKYGNVDEVKTEIESLLDGGAEAFRMRMKKYGHGSSK